MRNFLFVVPMAAILVPFPGEANAQPGKPGYENACVRLPELWRRPRQMGCLHEGQRTRRSARLRLWRHLSWRITPLT